MTIFCCLVERSGSILILGIFVRSTSTLKEKLMKILGTMFGCPVNQNIFTFFFRMLVFSISKYQ